MKDHVIKCVCLVDTGDYPFGPKNAYRAGDICYLLAASSLKIMYYSECMSIYFSFEDFHKYFVKLDEYRNQKIDEILK